MRLSYIFLLCAASLGSISGCGTSVSSSLRQDAHTRFTSILAGCVEKTAPEETGNIRSTLALADRYFSQGMDEDAYPLYRVSLQKTQLLQRSLGPAGTCSAEVSTVSKGDAGADFGTGLYEDERTVIAPGADDHCLGTDTAPNETEIGTASAASTPSPQAGRRASARRVSSGSNSGRDLIRRNSPERTTIYLTFDDGPSKLTLPIASFLSSEGIPATFFVLGSNVKGHEKTIRATAAMGHRIGSHTMSHNLQKLKASFDAESNEVRRARELIEPLGGDGRMVRIPYGDSSKKILNPVAAEGAQVFEWDINSYDSTTRGVKDYRFIERNVLRQVNAADKRHIVILFHDGAGHGSTLVALKSLVPQLKQLGYRFSTLARSEKTVTYRTDGRATP